MPMWRASSRATRRWPSASPGNDEPLVLGRGEVLGRAGDHALGQQVVDDDRRQEVVLSRAGGELADVVLEALVERLGDEVHVAVGDRAHGVDPTAHAEDLLVDAQYGLQVAVLVGDLRGQQELHVVARRGEQERREQSRDAELRVEAVGEDPDHAGLGARLERLEAAAIGLEVERERRPLVALPVRVERAERRCALLEGGDFSRCLGVGASEQIMGVSHRPCLLRRSLQALAAQGYTSKRFRGRPPFPDRRAAPDRNRRGCLCPPNGWSFGGSGDPGLTISAHGATLPPRPRWPSPSRRSCRRARRRRPHRRTPPCSRARRTPRRSASSGRPGADILNVTQSVLRAPGPARRRPAGGQPLQTFSDNTTSSYVRSGPGRHLLLLHPVRRSRRRPPTARA